MAWAGPDEIHDQMHEFEELALGLAMSPIISHVKMNQ